MTERQQKITFGEMCSTGTTRILLYCADRKCSHSIELDADYRFCNFLRFCEVGKVGEQKRFRQPQKQDQLFTPRSCAGIFFVNVA